MTAPGALRQDAVACLLAGVEAVRPGPLTTDYLRAHLGSLGGKVRIAAVGKAAVSMAGAAVDALGDRLTGGVVVAPGELLANGVAGLDGYAGGHPVPNEEGVAGARAVLELAAGLGEDERLLCLISGGGSALMTLPPPGVSLADVQETTELLLKAGATIQELNCVRKHLDLLKGGRLAAAAAPARVLSLVLSDVVGDPLDVIASGPTSPDPTTFADARAVLEGRGVWRLLPAGARAYLERGLAGREPESPGPDDAGFERVETIVIGNNALAAEAVAGAAAERGYASLILTTVLTGEAREAGRVLAAIGLEARRSGRPLAPPACLVVAGETTVTVTGDGSGGRNQELVLGAAQALDGTGGVLVASLGTDGIDGPTDAAGAVADGDSVRRAGERGLDVAGALARNDAYPLLAALDDLIVTGPTGTNVMDLQVVLVGAR